MVRIVEENLVHLLPPFNRPSVMPWEKTGSKKESSMTVAIPKEWAAFFCSLLRDPSHFAWAKDFVISNSAALLNPNGSATLLEVPKNFIVRAVRPALSSLIGNPLL